MASVIVIRLAIEAPVCLLPSFEKCIVRLRSNTFYWLDHRRKGAIVGFIFPVRQLVVGQLDIGGSRIHRKVGTSGTVLPDESYALHHAHS